MGSHLVLSSFPLRVSLALHVMFQKTFEGLLCSSCPHLCGLRLGHRREPTCPYILPSLRSPAGLEQGPRPQDATPTIQQPGAGHCQLQNLPRVAAQRPPLARRSRWTCPFAPERTPLTAALGQREPKQQGQETRAVHETGSHKEPAPCCTAGTSAAGRGLHAGQLSSK